MTRNIKQGLSEWPYRGEEILESLGGDEGEVHKAEVPGEGVLDGVPQAIPGASDLLLDATVGAEHTVLRHLLLFGGQEAGVVRPVGQQPESGKGDKDGDRALDDEEPLPRVKSKGVIHGGEDTRGEEAGNNVADGVAGVPNGHAQRALGLVVPGRGHCKLSCQ